MTKRLFLAAFAALALAACGAEGGKSGAPQAAATAPGYTLDVFARNDEQIYLISSPGDDHLAAARVVDHNSSVIAPDEARSLLAERQQLFHPQPDNNAVDIRAGGFSLKINGDGDTNSKEGGSAHIDINAGGHGVSIDAQDNGDNSGHARVHITGADHDTARKFISDADDLSADVKTQMLQSLGL